MVLKVNNAEVFNMDLAGKLKRVETSSGILYWENSSDSYRSKSKRTWS